MYEYAPIKPSFDTGRIFPVDNMKFNGKYLDDIINGYRQLNVSGRDLVSRKIDTTPVPRRRGEWFNYIQDESREITVEFMMEAESSHALRDEYAILNKHLRSDVPVPIQFDDEPEYTYYGVYVESPSKPEDRLMFKGELTIICPDPYKYKTLSKSEDGRINNLEADFVYPKRMVLMVTTQSDLIEVTNGTHRIVLKGSYAPSNKIEIVWGDEVTITYQNRSLLPELQLYSDLEFFELKNGMNISATNAEVSLIEWSDERL